MRLPLDLVAAAYVLLYLFAAGRVRDGWPLRRSAAFAAGVACVLIALQSGIDTFDDQLLSVHMVQHMLLLLLAPLLLLLGHPVMLGLRALPPSSRWRLARALARTRRMTGPLQCLALFYVVLLGTHLPAFYDSAIEHPILHEFEHVLYLIAGALMWWPIIGADPVPSHRLGGLGRAVYLLATMPPMALIGAYLNRHPVLVYASYARPAHVLGVRAVVDQQQAGAIMWVAGNTIMVLAGLWAVMAALVAEERRQRSRDAHALLGEAEGRAG